jgi:glucose-1-phosphate adenylyltransferase
MNQQRRGADPSHRRLDAQQHNDSLMHLARRAHALVLAGGRGSRLLQLTDQRAKPALPFAGKLRIIDFPLSNCVNSGIRRVSVLTQYKAQSLIRHIERGWGFLDAGLGEYVDVVPAQQQLGSAWYSGTADAVYQNLNLLREAAPAYVLILAGDHVYKMDYARLLADHVATGADVTVACTEVALSQASSFGVVAVDPDGRIRAFDEKPAQPAAIPGRPDCALISMGIYVFGADLLGEQLTRDAADPGSSHDFGHDLLPWLVRSHRVQASRFADSCVNRVEGRPYWRDVGTVDAYWEANLDLTRVVPELNLYDDDWPIRSVQDPHPPAKFVLDDGEGRRSQVINSLVSNGCIVSGATVRSSLLFSKVRVAERSLVEDSVVLGGAVIGRGVVLRRVVVDEGCVIPDHFKAGLHPAEDRAHWQVTPRGIVLITPAMLGQPGR